MHDEVSETENIRCNLGIEKMIVEGCEVILDANQVFIREGMNFILSFKVIEYTEYVNGLIYIG